MQNVLAYLRNLSLPYKIAGGVGIVVLLAVGFHFVTRQAPAPAAAVETPHVTLASVASLASEGGPLSLVGKVTSLNQATLLAQASGGLVSLSKQIGDQVAAGDVIGQIDDSSQQAALLQAQGAYDAAVAGQSSVSPVDSKAAALNAYNSAYGTLDTALQSDIDTFFGGPTTYGPQLLISAPMYNYGELSQERAALTDEMAAYQRALPDATTADPLTLLTNASTVAQDVSDFINKLAAAANALQSEATPTQLAALTTARTSVSALLTTLSAAEQSYRAGSVTSTASPDASVTSALGGLQAAQANVEKTVIRSPIAGTIVSLPVTLGDFINTGTEVAEVSNPSALEIDTYVTPDDAKTLSVNAPVMIEGNVTGVIISIAPALDPTTNEIEVKIGITGDQSALTDGDTVSISLTRSVVASTTQAATGALTIPITAVKVLPAGAVVLTVSSSTIATLPVTLGTILGDQVTILSGLTPATEIVTDARGLSSGETVIVDTE